MVTEVRALYTTFSRRYDQIVADMAQSLPADPKILKMQID